MSGKTIKETVGILGNGEIGSAIARICKEANLNVLIRELNFDQVKDKKIDYLHVNIAEKSNWQFINIVSKNIKELSPKLTIINSSVSLGTTREIHRLTKSDIVHSPIIGSHPYLYESIKFHFPKIIGPVNISSKNAARKHFKNLRLKIAIYDSSENSEAAKLLDLVYYAWDIIFCKWVKEVCKNYNLNFEQVYTKHNKIYNRGYRKLRPNVIRPILVPVDGPIGGHCTIEDTILFDKNYKNRFTKFILKEQKYFQKSEEK